MDAELVEVNGIDPNNHKISTVVLIGPSYPKPFDTWMNHKLGMAGAECGKWWELISEKAPARKLSKHVRKNSEKDGRYTITLFEFYHLSFLSPCFGAVWLPAMISGPMILTPMLQVLLKEYCFWEKKKKKKSREATLVKIQWPRLPSWPEYTLWGVVMKSTHNYRSEW